MILSRGDICGIAFVMFSSAVIGFVLRNLRRSQVLYNWIGILPPFKALVQLLVGKLYLTSLFPPNSIFCAGDYCWFVLDILFSLVNR